MAPPHWTVDLKLTRILDTSRVGNNGSREDRQLVAADFVEIANRTVNDHALQSFQPGRKRSDFTPQGCIEFSLPVNHEHTAFRTMRQSDSHHEDVCRMDAHGDCGPAIRQLAEKQRMS